MPNFSVRNEMNEIGTKCAIRIVYKCIQGESMKSTIFLAFPLLFACSEMNLKSSMESSADYEESGDASYSPEDQASEPNEGGASDYDDGFGSETESDFMSLRPATTNVYVFVANPDRNTVTRITVPDLDVLRAEVGVSPSLVETSSSTIGET